MRYYTFLKKIDMKKILLFLCLPLSSFSQKLLYVHLVPYVQGMPLDINTPFTGWDGKAVKIDHFNYYFSYLTIKHDGGQVLNLSDTVFLVKPDNHLLDLGYHNITNVEQISFLVGVPDRLNTESGTAAQDISLYPENHPLSFQSPSMYWGWQAGYMHMIVGGSVDGNNDGITETNFQLHNLGNSNQQSVINMPVIQTNTNDQQIDINVRCNLDFWLKNINLTTVGNAHGETGLNAFVMDNVLTETVFNQGADASLQTIDQALMKVKTDFDKLSIEWSGMKNISACTIYDESGIIVSHEEVKDSNGSFTMSNLNSGLVIIKLTDNTGKKLAERKVIIP
jgi:hypothetical protein